MASRRGATGLAGLLVIDKPAGLTSHDVVNAVRRATGERRIGHAGTLDPSATGVLMVLVGPYTRLERYLSGKRKTYEAVIAFGVETDTDDADGSTTRTASVDPRIFDPALAARTLAGFLGERMQTPPAYSAIKVEGRTAHRVARAGGEITLEDRPIIVHEAALLDSDAAEMTWRVRFTVSKGTYIRALARDLGRATGSAAHLLSLRRTASGSVDLTQSVSLDDVVSAKDVSSLFVDPLPALSMPTLAVDTDGAAFVRDGRPLTIEGAPADGTVAITADDRLIAVYRAGEGRLSAETVLGMQT